MQEEDRSAGLRQAERYGGPASHGRGPAAEGARPPGPSVKSAYIGGAAMIGATILSGLLGAPALLAFLIGLAAFALVVASMRPGGVEGALGSVLGGPIKVDRAAAKAAGLDADRAEARLTEADGALRRIEAMAAALDDRDLSGRLRAMTAAARETLRALAEDPGDIDRARKFLVVTIPSAEAAVEKFARLGVRDHALAERFGALVDEVAAAAEKQKASLRRDDALALEVEMEVLAERLAKE